MSQPSLTPPSNFLVTQLQTLPEHTDYEKLHEYLSDLQSKFQYAEWKQNLILKFNYMPLANIKQKIETQKLNYYNRMMLDDAKCKAITQNKDYLQQMSNMKKFKEKLEGKIKQYQRFIAARKELNCELNQKLKDKKNQLKEAMKANMIITKNKLQSQGVYSQKELAIYRHSQLSKKARSKLSMTRRNSVASYSTQPYQSISHKQSAPKIINHYESIKSREQAKSNKLYCQCLASFYDSIHQSKLKAQQENEAKILDHLERKLSTRHEEGKNLLKISKQVSHKKIQSNIIDEINWETFRQSSATQIIKLSLKNMKIREALKQLI